MIVNATRQITRVSSCFNRTSPGDASIDWTIKESVKAKLKVIIKRTLRQFGYPPDMQLLAKETVLRQAEMIAGELSKI